MAPKVKLSFSRAASRLSFTTSSSVEKRSNAYLCAAATSICARLRTLSNSAVARNHASLCFSASAKASWSCSNMLSDGSES